MGAKNNDIATARFDVVNDGWQNLLTNVGNWQKDKRQGARVVENCMTFEELRELFKGNSMASRICTKPAEEMTRKGWCVQIADDDGGEQGETIDAALDVIGAKAVVKQALEMQRWAGGCAVLVGVNDSKGIEGLKQPVNEKGIRSVDYLNLFDPREATVTDYENNALAKDFKKPKIYRLNPRTLGLGSTLGVIDVHASRILRFSGPVSTGDDLLRNYGWGDSILNRVWDVLRNFGLSWDGAAALIQDFAQAVYKISGLHEAIASDREQLVIKRLQLMDLSRGYLRGIALDKDGEDFERKPTPIAGLKDLLDGFNLQMASAANMPVSVLFGEGQHKGLGDSGQENTRNWYDQIAAMQEAEISPQLTQLARYIMLAKQGPTRGIEPEDWSIKFKSLWQLTEEQQADVELKNAQADASNIMNGIIRPEEARKRYESDEYGYTLQLEKAEQAAYEAQPEPSEGDPATGDLRQRGAAELAGEDPPQAAKPAAPATPPLPKGTDGQPIPALIGKAGAGAAPAGPSSGGGDAAQDTALSGQQISAALEIISQVAQEQIPRESGIAMLVAFFNLQSAAAEAIMGKVGQGWKPTPPEPTVVHLGPDGKPAKPAPKPGEAPYKAPPKGA